MRPTKPAIIAPRIGATQNSHSCASAAPPTKRAGPVLRAGLTEVFVTGIEIRWIRVRARPIGMPAKPVAAPLEVVPMMIIRKTKVRTSSVRKQESIDHLLRRVGRSGRVELREPRVAV